MIILQEENGRLSAMHSEGRSHPLQLFGRWVLLWQLQDEEAMRLPADINEVIHEKLLHRRHLVFQYKEQTSSLSLYEGNGYGSYVKYALDNSIVTIGSAVENDVYLQDEHLLPSQFQIHLLTRRIYAEDGIQKAFLNGRQMEREESFTDGMVMQILNLRIILSASFLMINQGPNIFCSLDAYHPDCHVHMIRDLQPLHFVRSVFPDTRMMCERIEAPRKQEIAAEEGRPLFLMMGPPLMMAVGAFTMGSLSAWNSYLDGRSWQQVLPMILLPGLMAVSTLLFTPLNRLYEIRKRKKQLKRCEKAYQSSCLTMIAQWEDQAQKYQDMCDALWPSPCYLHKDIDQLRHLSCLDPLDQRFWLVHCGMRENHVQCSEAAIQTALRQNIPNIPFVFSIDEGMTHIQDESPEKTIQNSILLQLLCRHSPKDLSLIFVLQHPDDFPSAMMIPHARYNGRRMIMSLETYESKGIQIEDNRTALIICFAQCEVSMQGKRMLVFSNVFQPEADRVLQYDNCRGQLIERCHQQVIPFVSPAWNGLDLLRMSSAMAWGKLTDNLQEKKTFLEIHGMQEVREADIVARWQNNHASRNLKAVIGSKGQRRIILDLHEHQDGPHGLIAGTTGSGKSELILTMLLSLAVTYSPQDVQIGIIDFKGNTIAQALTMPDGRMIPHVAGVLSNLEAHHAQRAIVSLQNECLNRQKLFVRLHEKTGENINDLDAYRMAWKPETNLPYLGHLVVVIDEFAQLKQEMPAFMDDLIAMARIGRSLGIHLILSTQKPAGVINDQIWANTRFKICLRVMDEQDSREIIKDPCAISLGSPGSFYLKRDQQLVKGQAGYVNGPCANTKDGIQQLSIFGNAVAESRHHPIVSERMLVLSALAKAKKETGMQAEQLWLDEPGKLTASDIKGKHVIGILDDYWHRVHRPYLRQEMMAVFSEQAKSTDAFFELLVYKCCLDAGTEEIYVIAGKQDTGRYDKCRRLSGVIDCQDEDRLLLLHHHLEQNKTKAVLLIKDYRMLAASSIKTQELLHRWIQHHAQMHLSLCIFASNASIVQYQDLLCFSQRIVLGCSSRQEAATIFEMPVGELPAKEGRAWVIDEDHLLQISWPQVDEHLHSDRNAPWLLPSMPAHIKPSLCHEKGIAIGISCKDYQWKLSPEDKLLIVTALSPDNAQNFLRALQQQKLPVAFGYKQLGGMIHGIVFVTLSDIVKCVPDMYTILFVGPGLKHQYTLHAKIEEDLRKEEGMLFRNGSYEKIRLIEADDEEQKEEADATADYRVSLCCNHAEMV